MMHRLRHKKISADGSFSIEVKMEKSSTADRLILRANSFDRSGHAFIFLIDPCSSGTPLSVFQPNGDDIMRSVFKMERERNEIITENVKNVAQNGTEVWSSLYAFVLTTVESVVDAVNRAIYRAKDFLGVQRGVYDNEKNKDL